MTMYMTIVTSNACTNSYSDKSGARNDNHNIIIIIIVIIIIIIIVIIIVIRGKKTGVPWPAT